MCFRKAYNGYYSNYGAKLRKKDDKRSFCIKNFELLEYFQYNVDMFIMIF